MNQRFQNIISNTPSPWLEDAKRRQRWKWLRKPIFRIKLKCLRLKRKHNEGF